ncbi:MAG: HAMP domain-containing sensor histidine kinase [Gammaproteobacteria bacterium]|nr:HAMP domain-containing sensor histidine kinase [Gammaproteobacteria bacterium]
MAEQPAILTAPGHMPADTQNVTLFRIYVLYRTLLSILLLLSLVSVDTRQVLGVHNPELYLNVAIVYLATNLALVGVIKSRFTKNQALLFVIFFIDILAITLMADASGGMNSGLPILLIVTAAASATLISSGSIATLIAALSIIALLADTMRLINEQILGINSLFPAGLLGSLIFAVSILIQMVARRLGKAEALARKRAADLYDLQRLNEQIVQHMEIGILLVYESGAVRVMNQAATRLLDPKRPMPMEQGRLLEDYHEGLAQQFEDWQSSGEHNPSPLDIRGDAPPVIANFRTLQSATRGDALVFVEDYSPVTQYAQSLKLASLGRLTASIAHEIRNPLGAISHAAQLLGESEELSDDDQRLTDIIQQHTQRMNAIIENVMHISRRQPPNPERLVMKDWLEHYLEEYRAGLSGAPLIKFAEAPEEAVIQFDPKHLQRVLGNLLDNALRHSKLANGVASADVVISWEYLIQRCLIDVIDHGEGVSADEQVKLFEPFYTTVEKGTGLGLYLCKELCEINKATLAYRRTSSGRSCFRIAISPHK